MKDYGIRVVDYGMGNLGSVCNAFARLGARCEVTDTPDGIAGARAIVMPGVGAFASAMANLRHRNLVDALTDRVVDEGVPFLGICLGLQLLARSSTEHGQTSGLGWIDGDVTRLSPQGGLPVPHVGWNQIVRKATSPLLANVGIDAHCYFDHGYHLECDPSLVTSTCDYGGDCVASIAKGNIQAVQFHPEKSQRTGLRILRNFLRTLTEGS